MDTPRDEAVLGIHNGRIFLTNIPPVGEVSTRRRVVWTIDPKNPTAKRVFWDVGKDPSSTPVQAFTPISMNSAGLSYSVMRNPPLSSEPIVASSGAAGNVAVGGGGFVQQPNVAFIRVSPGEMEKAIPKPLSPAEYDLVAKEFDSSPARTLISKFPGVPTAQVKGNTFWIQEYVWTNVPKRFTTHKEGAVTYVYTFPPCSRLMVSNSETSEFTGQIVERTALKAGSDGVYWTEGGPNERKLCYLPLGAKVPLKLGAYAGIGLPEECNDKIYWIEIPPKPIGSTTNAPANEIEIKCASRNLDGVRSFAIVKLGHPQLSLARAHAKLFGVNGRLYILAPEWNGAGSNSSTDTPSQNLYEVSEHNLPNLRLCGTLPPKSAFAQIDGGYCYYFVQEQRERWWDWSDKGLIPQQVSVLFRSTLH